MDVDVDVDADVDVLANDLVGLVVVVAGGGGVGPVSPSPRQVRWK